MKKLLFVCSGNSCRSPMASAIAKKSLGDKAECDSAAGRLVNDNFKAGKNVSSMAARAIKKLDIGNIGAYRPKPLSEELVKKADKILFLGQEFLDNGKKKFPPFESKMTYYGSYASHNSGNQMIDIPDPHDGQSWEDYFGTAWPGKTNASYRMVAEAMRDDFQKKLEI